MGKLLAVQIVVAGMLLGSAASAQDTESLGIGICNHPQACSKLHCAGACTEVWDHGVCKGGYCAQGFVASNKSGVTIVVHDAPADVQQNLSGSGLLDQYQLQ
jgi:hypothetical protein